MNQVAIMGRLTADPELKTTPQNTHVVAFSVAVNRAYKKDAAQQTTDFFDCVAWRGTAEVISKYFRKGQQIAIEGKLQTRSYEDKNGSKRKAVEILAQNVFFCGDNKQHTKTEENGQTAFSEDFAPIAENEEDLPF